ncbi:hypothetical protein AHAS_Ahas18G0172400 [Arachis hypogaea]
MPMLDMVHKAFNFSRLHDNEEDSENEHAGAAADELPYLYNEPSREARNHIKSICVVSDKAFGMILEFLVDAFEHPRTPSTMHDAKKVIRKLGVAYKKIDACPNDCMPYQGNDLELTKCKRCGT